MFMKAVVQRVKRCNVRIDGKIVGEISKGLLVLIGINNVDNIDTIKWMANKLLNLRIFPDEEDKMNKSLLDINGELLIVSNFTLYGDVQRGFRPSFSKAAVPEISEPIYDNLINYIKENFNIKLATGIFGAMMDIELINDGPVTIIIEK